MIDCIVVGSGFCGSVIARRLAEECGCRVRVVEKRNHIAGNMYDRVFDSGIRVQQYGPHIFHTNNEEVFRFLQRYGEWVPFELRCRVEMDGVIVPSPFNLTAIDMMFEPDRAQALRQALERHYPGQTKTTVVEMLQHEEPIIRAYAEMLFEKDYRPYTAKQWGIPPEEIDVSVLKRVPILLTEADRYFDDAFQAMPKDGFHRLFESMLDHPLIEVQLEEDALDSMTIDAAASCVRWAGEDRLVPIVYSGAIDALLRFEFGKLPYRSLKFRYETLPMDSFQPAAVVAYPMASGYTRITEYKKLPDQAVPGVTTVAYEYPLQHGAGDEGELEPFYPIPNDGNRERYERYAQVLRPIRNLFPCGRLADYRYYNMDDAVLRAFEVFGNLRDFLSKD